MVNVAFKASVSSEYKRIQDKHLLQASVNRAHLAWWVLQVLTDGGEQDWDQQERPLGSSQSHSWPSLKHCSNMETSGQQSPHWAEQRSFREKQHGQSASLANSCNLKKSHQKVGKKSRRVLV